MENLPVNHVINGNEVFMYYLTSVNPGELSVKPITVNYQVITVRNNHLCWKFYVIPKK